MSETKSISVTLLVSKPPTSMFLSFMQPANIPLRSSAFAVLKLLTSRLSIFEHSPNIYDIFFTLDVSNELRSSFVRELQYLNISSMLTTFLVLKLLRSTVLSDLHEMNIPCIDFTDEVFILPSFIVSAARQVHILRLACIEVRNIYKSKIFTVDEHCVHICDI